ncbi:MAG TPA: amidohydrolase family protein, partial [Erythrobacter sp.]|nr:amidohydrolase family protein [Erythrobacter sp.]
MRVFSGLMVAAAALMASPALADTTVIHAGSVIKDAAGQPSGPATITVTDGRIVSIEDGFQPTPE